MQGKYKLIISIACKLLIYPPFPFDYIATFRVKIGKMTKNTLLFLPINPYFRQKYILPKIVSFSTTKSIATKKWLLANNNVWLKKSLCRGEISPRCRFYT